MTALRFYKTYRRLKARLSKALWDVIEGFGDDGYGDVIDSFPLFGRERAEKALKGEIEGESRDQYQGENYIGMSLENALFEYYASSCRFECSPEAHDPF